jgi:transposase
VSTLDHMLEPEAVRRLELITGTGRRRRFSTDDKDRIVEETFAPSAVVSAVARRHGLTPQQLFTSRRQARDLTRTETSRPLFVPAVVEARAAEAKPSGRRGRCTEGRCRAGE